MNKNHCINFFKGLAAIGVICFHCHLNPMVEKAIYIAADFGLPFFLMVAGYYCRYKPNENPYKIINRKVYHTVFILFLFMLIYLIWTSLVAVMNGRPVLDAVFDIINIDNIVTFFMFGYIRGYWWFIANLLALYLVQYIFVRWNLNRYALIIAISSALLNDIISIGEKLFVYTVPYEVYHSIWLQAMPCFMFGIFLQLNEAKVLNVLKSKLLHLGLFCIALILEIREFFPEIRWGNGRSQLVLLLYTALIFIFAIKHPQKKIWVPINRIGQDYYLFFYIIHPIVTYYTNSIFIRIGLINNIYLLTFYPIIITVICYYLASIFYSPFVQMKITNCIKHLKLKKG